MIPGPVPGDDRHRCALKAIALVLIGIGIGGRLIPHIANFTPIMALSLYCGLCLPSVWIAMALPLISLLLSDAVLGFYDPALMAFVYIGLILPVLPGLFIPNLPAWPARCGLAVGAGLVFFGLSNFGVWQISGAYPLTMDGLLECYESALPFLRNTLIGNLLWSAILFGPIRAILHKSEQIWQSIPLFFYPG